MIKQRGLLLLLAACLLAFVWLSFGVNPSSFNGEEWRSLMPYFFNPLPGAWFDAGLETNRPFQTLHIGVIYQLFKFDTSGYFFLSLTANLAGGILFLATMRKLFPLTRLESLVVLAIAVFGVAPSVANLSIKFDGARFAALAFWGAAWVALHYARSWKRDAAVAALFTSSLLIYENYLFMWPVLAWFLGLRRVTLSVKSMVEAAKLTWPVFVSLGMWVVARVLLLVIWHVKPQASPSSHPDWAGLFLLPLNSIGMLLRQLATWEALSAMGIALAIVLSTLIFLSARSAETPAAGWRRNALILAVVILGLGAAGYFIGGYGFQSSEPVAFYRVCNVCWFGIALAAACLVGWAQRRWSFTWIVAAAFCSIMVTTSLGAVRHVILVRNELEAPFRNALRTLTQTVPSLPEGSAIVFVHRSVKGNAFSGGNGMRALFRMVYDDPKLEVGFWFADDYPAVDQEGRTGATDGTNLISRGMPYPFPARQTLFVEDGPAGIRVAPQVSLTKLAVVRKPGIETLDGLQPTALPAAPVSERSEFIRHSLLPR